MCNNNKIKLINHDSLTMLVLLYIMLYIMLAALCSAVCLYNAFLSYRFLQMLLVIMLCLGLLTHSLLISSIIFHHAQCF